MNSTERELLNALKAQPTAVERTLTSVAITSATTTQIVAAGASGQRVKIWGLWISGRNDHASEVLKIKLQDDTGTPIVYAEIFVGPTSQVNGFINLSETPLFTGVDKKLNCVTTAGTPTVRVVALTSYV